MGAKKVIIVGASSGIGKELAKIFSRRGCVVGITARRGELLEEVARELPAKSFARCMDVANPEAAVGIFEELVKEMGGVNVVVISAGVGFINHELEWKKEKDTIDVNVAGFAAIAASAMKHFFKQGAGQLVGISSLAALRGGADGPAYGASKAFVSNYLEALRLKARGMKLPITVTDIRPGFVDTAMAQGEGLFWVASPEKAALQIFTAIEKKKKLAYVTRRWGFVAWLLKFAPDCLLARQAKA